MRPFNDKSAFDIDLARLLINRPTDDRFRCALVYEVERAASGLFECPGPGCNSKDRNPYKLSSHLRECSLFERLGPAGVPWTVVTNAKVSTNGNIRQPHAETTWGTRRRLAGASVDHCSAS